MSPNCEADSTDLRDIDGDAKRSQSAAKCGNSNAWGDEGATRRRQRGREAVASGQEGASPRVMLIVDTSI